MISPYTYFMFRILSHQSTMDILTTLYQNTTQTFTQIRDYCKLNNKMTTYYLLKLQSFYMVEKTRDGYKLTYRGYDIVKTVDKASEEMTKL